MKLTVQNLYTLTSSNTTLLPARMVESGTRIKGHHSGHRSRGSSGRAMIGAASVTVVTLWRPRLTRGHWPARGEHVCDTTNQPPQTENMMFVTLPTINHKLRTCLWHYQPATTNWEHVVCDTTNQSPQTENMFVTLPTSHHKLRTCCLWHYQPVTTNWEHVCDTTNQSPQTENMLFVTLPTSHHKLRTCLWHYQQSPQTENMFLTLPTSHHKLRTHLWHNQPETTNWEHDVCDTTNQSPQTENMMFVLQPTINHKLRTTSTSLWHYQPATTNWEHDVCDTTNQSPQTENTFVTQPTSNHKLRTSLWHYQPATTNWVWGHLLAPSPLAVLALVDTVKDLPQSTASLT